MVALRHHFRPADLPAARLAACLGVLADTHMPERLAALPSALHEVLDGVDLVLHAGDLSELWVLDRLRGSAPVLAVRGNDEAGDAGRHLPDQHLVTVAGGRLLLTHGHYPDRTEELASRADDRWAPKLAYRAELGRRAGASVVIFGHIHIPLAVHHAGVLLVNPGALAAASGATRQRRQTVALLYVRDDGAVTPVHVDLADLARPYVPRIDWAAGFRAAHDQYQESILSPELAADFAYLRTQAWWNLPDEGRPLWAAWYRAARRCWTGELPRLTRADVLAEVRADEAIPVLARSRFTAALSRPLPPRS